MRDRRQIDYSSAHGRARPDDRTGGGQSGTLLAMAALAVDVVTLYVARSEMQRAADAAALAGAKAFVDSGVTSLATTDPNYATVQGLAQTMATPSSIPSCRRTKIQGTPPVLVGAPAFDFTRPGNPQVSCDSAAD